MFSSRPATHPTHLHVAHQVMHYVETHLDQPLTIRTIGEEVGISYFYLHHLFTDTVGENLGHYIKRVRLEHAYGYLKHSAYTVGDIGDLTGFGSKHSFSRAFSQFYNQSPTTARFRQTQVIPNSMAHNPSLISDFSLQWKNRMRHNDYQIRSQPPATYCFQYLGVMTADGGASFSARLQRVFDLYAMLKLPIAFSSSGIGCATRLGKYLIRAGFVVQDNRISNYLRQYGFLQRALEGGNYLTARFEGSPPQGGVMTYCVIQESVREGLFQLRDHNSLILVDPSWPDQFETWIPVT